MAYNAEISRTNPTCFLFLIDQSGSMSEPIGGQSGSRKADGVADALNKLLQNLIIKSCKSEGVRDYFHIGVIGYGTGVSPVLGGGRAVVPISEIANSPLRVEQRTKKVPHVQRLTAGDERDGQTGRIPSDGSLTRVCLQRRLGVRDSVSGHRHEGRPKREMEVQAKTKVCNDKQTVTDRDIGRIAR